MYRANQTWEPGWGIPGAHSMSVGGRVIEVIALPEDKLVWVNTNDAPEGKRPNECAVIVDAKGEDIRPGDALWWQSGTCYWTPRGREDKRVEVRLKKMSSSGVFRPNQSLRADGVT